MLMDDRIFGFVLYYFMCYMTTVSVARQMYVQTTARLSDPAHANILSGPHRYTYYENASIFIYDLYETNFMELSTS
jgi:hypothetical protein